MERLVLWYAHVDEGVPLVEVCGLTLCERAVLTAEKAGIATGAVVVHAADELVVRALLENDPRVKGTWDVLSNSDVQAAAKGVEELIVVLGDRVFLKGALDQLVEPLEGAAGRALPDEGLVRVHRRDDLALPGGIADLPIEGLRTGFVQVRSDADVSAAEVLLIRSLTKKADGVVARNINRKISGRITRVLAPYNVSPNMVTAVVAAVGIMSYPFGAIGSYFGFVMAGLCYYVSAVLDGVDGELSRLKFLSSPTGAWLDTITDDVVGTAYLVGLYVGLNRAADHGWWSWIGIMTIVFYLMTILPRYWLLIYVVGTGDHQVIAAQRLAEEKGAFGKAVDAVANTIFRLDFLTLFSFVVAVFNAPWIFAGGYAIGSVIAIFETAYTIKKVRAGAAA